MVIKDMMEDAVTENDLTYSMVQFLFDQRLKILMDINKKNQESKSNSTSIDLSS